MKAGDLREFVTLMRPSTVTTDTYGRNRTTYTDVCECPAQVADVSSKEFYDAAAHGLEDTVTVTVRWVDGVDATWRVRYLSSELRILEVNHLGYKRDFIRLKCRKA